jgi:hypothetical protein
MGLVLYRLEDIDEVLRSYSQFMVHAPDELTADVLLWTTPDLPSVPEEVIGRPSLVIVACYSGPLEQGDQVFAPLRSLARPLTDLSGPIEFLKIQDLSRSFGAKDTGGSRHYWKSIYVNDLSPELISILKASTVRRPSLEPAITIYGLGGLYARIGPDEAALDNRDQRFLVAIEADWAEQADDTANIEWARSTFNAIQKHFETRVYLNFPGFAEEEKLVETSFGGNYPRLREIKARYDPMNLFRGHLDIRPSVQKTQMSSVRP